MTRAESAETEFIRSLYPEVSADTREGAEYLIRYGEEDLALLTVLPLLEQRRDYLPTTIEQTLRDYFEVMPEWRERLTTEAPLLARKLAQHREPATAS